MVSSGTYLVKNHESIPVKKGLKMKMLLPLCNQTVNQASVVQTLDSAIHRINHYPADSLISFPNTYLLDSDLSGG